MLTQQRLKEIFSYNDGQLFRRGKTAGSVNKRGYRVVYVDGKIYKAHRLVFFYHHGFLPIQVDHVDGNKDNNRIENLRAATNSQNRMNCGVQRNNTSGHKNVYWDVDAGKWAVKVRVDKKLRTLGRFASIDDAIVAAAAGRKKLHGEFAHPGV